MTSLVPDFNLQPGLIAILGDTRPRDYLEFVLESTDGVAARVFELVAGRLPCAMIHCGDLAVFGSRRSFWKGWRGFDEDSRPVLDAGIPIFPALGNHEYRGPGGNALTQYKSRFPHLAGRRWYSIGIGNTLFLILDSNLGRLGPLKIQQEEWIRRMLEDASADASIRHVVPVWHHPAFTNVSRRYGVPESRSVQKRLLPLFSNERLVQVTFSGHVHTYERLRVDGLVHVVTGGGGSPRFHLRRPSGQKRIDLCADPRRLRPFHFLELRIGTGDESIEAKAIEVTLTDPPKTFDQFEVTSRS